jgi:p-hydroxybenzoate 3-monooxygenase
VVLERRSRDYVLSRIRAGVLEWGSVETLRRAGVGARMDAEGFVHEGTYLSAQNRGFRIDFEGLTGKRVMVYGQTEVTRDLYAARDAAGGTIIDEAEGVQPHGLDTEAPWVTYHQGRQPNTGSTAISSPAATGSTASAARHPRFGAAHL